MPFKPIRTSPRALLSPLASITALAAALALAGCASQGPDHPAYKELGAADVGLATLTTSADPSSAEAIAAPDWWKQLGDARLDALIDKALEGSPSLAASHARFDKAAALATASSTATDVHGTVSASATRQHYTENGMIPAPIAGNIYNSADLQAGLSWTPDFFGRYGAQLQAALGQARAAKADSAAAANQLAEKVARSYVTLARLLAQREVAERTLQQRQSLLELSQQRTRQGLDSQVELTQAEAGLPDAGTQIEMLDEQITLARRTIAVLCAEAPDAEAALTPELNTLQVQKIPTVLGADLLGRRPDVVAARWRVEAATQGIASARADFYPDINLTAFIGLNALGLDNLLKGSSRQFGMTPALRLPIFEGERLRAQLRGKQADLDTAIAQYNGVVLDAVKSAGDAIASVQSLERQNRLQTESLSKAERAYDFAVQRYKAGLANQIVVLNTEGQVITQRKLAVELRARELDTRIALMSALGGGWLDDTGTVQVSSNH
ncbi:efflux transporter outer membrane subunit [Diaphorobacter ruginosibacter]|uniref:Efflux transporter outer membrane subunit n=1 Tax=Diaphorobacter ruginosibacter TaxID=1715720 RepID=A0A7G9RJZ3_9BURK|nr:efflux transporter outer membrane subunit [Diaphorobacter ruginosibacter]QNN55918.1 efflux transporter outer membrane subunit [Diaphorobacter ruginosibacter]